MSATELEPPSAAPTRSIPVPPGSRPHLRLRHEVRDGFTAAGLSLAASIAVTGLLWVGLRWLG